MWADIRTLCNPHRTQQICTVSITGSDFLAASWNSLLKHLASNEPSASDMDTWLPLSLFRLNYKTVDIWCSGGRCLSLGLSLSDTARAPVAAETLALRGEVYRWHLGKWTTCLILGKTLACCQSWWWGADNFSGGGYNFSPSIDMFAKGNVCSFHYLSTNMCSVMISSVYIHYWHGGKDCCV